jgi:hypothetical protein
MVPENFFVVSRSDRNFSTIHSILITFKAWYTWICGEPVMILKCHLLLLRGLEMKSIFSNIAILRGKYSFRIYIATATFHGKVVHQLHLQDVEAQNLFIIKAYRREHLQKAYIS